MDLRFTDEENAFREEVRQFFRDNVPEHVRQNRASLDIALTSEDLGELDEAFPPPIRKRPLEMI